MRHAHLWALALALVLVTFVSKGSAQVSLNRFTPTPTFRDGFALSRPDVVGHLRVDFQALVDYAHEPLVWETIPGDSESVSFKPVHHQVSGHVVGALSLYDRVAVYVHLPASLRMSGNAASSGLPADGPALGNLALGARVSLLGKPKSKFALGLQGRIALPTSDWAKPQTNFSGEEKVSGRIQALGEYRNDGLRVDLNVGAQFRNARVIDTIEVGNELIYGLGVGYDVKLKRGVVTPMAELFGATIFTDFGQREDSPMEALIGFKGAHSKTGIGGGAAGSIGLTHGIGAPTTRVIGVLAWSTPEKQDPDKDGLYGDDDGCPTRPEDRDGFKDTDGCPDEDDDEDGIKDPVDKCPREREDMDQHDDTDGCPDQDNDSDGILDGADRCPMEAEDRDQFQDDDGCPEADNDQDGVTDANDKCPREPEDVDGFEDADGCPDPDNDKDGIADAADKCPLEAETQNGREDEDGCPDLIRVDRESGRIAIMEPVQFAKSSATILSASFDMLREIAQTMITHPELAHLSIEGHTDSQGADAANQKLSEQRARSVLDFLVKEGVPAERLSSQGFGETQPLADNATAEGRAKNRRVEFRL